MNLIPLLYLNTLCLFKVSFSFSKAIEQFYLLKEVDNFYHVSPRLLAKLQRWLVDKLNQIFQEHDSSQKVLEAAMDLLEWAPKQSKVQLF
jgi:hypothetical protein